MQRDILKKHIDETEHKQHKSHGHTQPVDEPYYNVKCAGMPQRCKNLFIQSMTGEREEKYTEDEKEFLATKRSICDFKIGLTVPSKLMPKRIKGGVVLQETTYEMRPYF